MILFSDKLVPYEVFIKDLAREIVAQTTEVLREPNDIISQNKAFKLFGAGNVRRWVKEEKLIPVSKRPGKIEYRVFDLKDFRNANKIILLQLKIYKVYGIHNNRSKHRVLEMVYSSWYATSIHASNLDG